MSNGLGHARELQTREVVRNGELVCIGSEMSRDVILREYCNVSIDV